MFKLGISEQDYALVREENYCEYLKQYIKEDSLLCRKLTETILPACREVSATYQQLNAKLTLTDNQLRYTWHIVYVWTKIASVRTSYSNLFCSALVRHGVLLPRDVGKMKSWWFAIPGISPFVKSLIKGRSTVQQMLKRSKFKEMLQSELEARKLGVSKLSMPYHIHDLIGSDLLER